MMTKHERFLSHYRVDSNDCWIWTGASTWGYGLFWDGTFTSKGNPRMTRAHRWSYRDRYGPIPKGLVLDHLCKKTLCVNPLHLEAVTQKENVNRSDTMGQKWTRGQGNGESKLTNEQVLAIRTDSRKQKDIAKDFNIDPSLVSLIKNRKRWAHI